MSEETITITLPRHVVEQISSPSTALLGRMHELLERNAEGSLTPLEQEHLETLVLLVQFSQIVSAMLAAAGQA